MKNITWTRISILFISMNFTASLITRNWIASMAWASAFCFLMALYVKEKGE